MLFIAIECLSLTQKNHNYLQDFGAHCLQAESNELLVEKMTLVGMKLGLICVASNKNITYINFINVFILKK